MGYAAYFLEGDISTLLNKFLYFLFARFIGGPNFLALYIGDFYFILFGILLKIEDWL
jgi:hypothetical protein